MIAERQAVSAPAFVLETGVAVTAAKTSPGGAVVGVVTNDGTLFSANVVIDATEYGDLMPLANAAYRVGSSRFDA